MPVAKTLLVYVSLILAVVGVILFLALAGASLMPRYGRKARPIFVWSFGSGAALVLISALWELFVRPWSFQYGTFLFIPLGVIFAATFALVASTLCIVGLHRASSGVA